MTFEEWWSQNVGMTDTEGVHNVCQSAWEASKAEERSRCAKLAELYTGIKDSQVQSTARVIAEQIRKGE